MTAAPAAVELLVVGPITRDLTLAIDAIPPAGGSVAAEATRAAVGGKGGNPAVAAARMGARVRLLGAVGDDPVAHDVLGQLRADGISTELVQRLPATGTGQIVHLVEPGGSRRYVESRGANEQLALEPARVATACRGADAVLVSTALPRAAVEAAVAGAGQADVPVVADLAGEADTSRAILPGAAIVRGDGDEVGELTGIEIDGFDSARAAAERLLALGPRQALVQAGGDGDLVLGADGAELRLPHLPVTLVDPTGGGDAFVSVFTVLTARGADLELAARLAEAAAAHTVSHLGGRPTFTGEAELAALAGVG